MSTAKSSYDPLTSLLNEFKDFKIMSLLECTSCGYNFERNYKEKEYVNKIAEDLCPKCNSKMYIKAIYVVREEKSLQRKSFLKGIPLIVIFAKFSNKILNFSKN
jgi:NAD-dependent SIR2 family protein deacetylase